MRFRTVEIGVAVAVCLSLHANVEAAARKATGAHAARKNPGAANNVVESRQPCGDWLGFQVRLDRLGFSSGDIDGLGGPIIARDLQATQSSKNLPSTGDAD